MHFMVTHYYNLLKDAFECRKCGIIKNVGDLLLVTIGWMPVTWVSRIQCVNKQKIKFPQETAGLHAASLLSSRSINIMVTSFDGNQSTELFKTLDPFNRS